MAETLSREEKQLLLLRLSLFGAAQTLRGDNLVSFFTLLEDVVSTKDAMLAMDRDRRS